MVQTRGRSRSTLVSVALLILGVGLWCFALMPFLFTRWSPPRCGNPCAGPSAWPAALIVVGSIAPLILLFVLTAGSRRTLLLSVATAVVSFAAFAIALLFESRVCPNTFANDCHSRGAVAALYAISFIGPVLVASFALGPIDGRSWTSFLALPLAGLVGLGMAAAPTAIRDAHIDGDTLFAYMIAWPIFLVPLICAAVFGSLVRWLTALSPKPLDVQVADPPSSTPPTSS